MFVDGIIIFTQTERKIAASWAFGANEFFQVIDRRLRTISVVRG
jgi:hypothetical protein